MIVSAIVGIALFVSNRASRNDEPRTPNLEPRTEPEHEQRRENLEA
jgi:hypothetical protein